MAYDEQLADRIRAALRGRLGSRNARCSAASRSCIVIADHHLVVITTPGGANRVYRSGSQRFSAIGENARVIDARGRSWTADEDRLQAEFDPGLRLPRVEAHRAFWFGWYAQYPDTVLFK